MQPYLTKTDFQRFLACPSSLWFAKHQRDQLDDPTESDLWRMEQGNLFEQLVRTGFPDGRLMPGHGPSTAQATKAAIAAGAQCLFQATAFSDDCLAMADILQRIPDADAWELFEVKSSTEVKDEHLDDVGFQHIVFENAGFNISKMWLIHVNSAAVRHGAPNAAEFSTAVDITDQVLERLDDLLPLMRRATAVNAESEPPLPSAFPCQLKPRDCPSAFHCYPDLPEFNVFDLPRIRFTVARDLYDRGISAIVDVDDLDVLTESQRVQVEMVQDGRPRIDRTGISEFLGQLQFPLTFLDYETLSPAIPLFDGYRPYEQMVFQYSVHVLRAPGAEPEHFEILADGRQDPAPDLVHSLMRAVPNSGSVLVWNRSFEVTRNQELAARVSESRQFFESLNDRIVDLMDVVRGGLYLHPEFRGSASLKSVLPVLVPDLGYEELGISDGGTASVMWHRSLAEDDEESRRQIREDLLRYCGRDTRALVELHGVFSQAASA